MLGLSGPAGAGKIFAVDGNGDDVNDGAPTDNVGFTFAGSGGTVTGTLGSVDLTTHTAGSLDPFVQSYFDFATSSIVDPDLTTLDILLFDVSLEVGSAPIDQIGVAVASDPFSQDPVGVGYFDPTMFGLPGASQVPNLLASSLISGSGTFPGAVLFDFDKDCQSTGPAMGSPASCSGNLQGGETSVRLFVAWDDVGVQSPLSKDQTAVFMMSSGTNQDFNVDIVPEPNTVLLVGLGLAILGVTRRRSA